MEVSFQKEVAKRASVKFAGPSNESRVLFAKSNARNNSISSHHSEEAEVEELLDAPDHQEERRRTRMSVVQVVAEQMIKSPASSPSSPTNGKKVSEAPSSVEEQTKGLMAAAAGGVKGAAHGNQNAAMLTQASASANTSGKSGLLMGGADYLPTGLLGSMVNLASDSGGSGMIAVRHARLIQQLILASGDDSSKAYEKWNRKRQGLLSAPAGALRTANPEVDVQLLQSDVKRAATKLRTKRRLAFVQRVTAEIRSNGLSTEGGIFGQKITTVGAALKARRHSGVTGDGREQIFSGVDAHRPAFSFR